MRTVTGLTIVVGLLLQTPAGAQQKYTIKLKELGKDEAAHVEVKETMVHKSKTSIEKDKNPPRTEEEKLTKHLVFTEYVLERPDPTKLPTRIKRVYDKAEVKGRKSPEGKELPDPPYHGKALLIEKKGNRYEFQVQGGATVKGDNDLEGEFNETDQELQKRLFLPAKAVAVGDSWAIDTKPLLQGFGKAEKAQVVKAEGTAKLTKVYKKDGRQFGVIETLIELHVKVSAKDEALKGELKSELKSKMKVTFDGCIDGSVAEGRVTHQGELNSTAVFQAPDQPAVTTVSSGITSSEDTWKQLPKK